MIFLSIMISMIFLSMMISISLLLYPLSFLQTLVYLLHWFSKLSLSSICFSIVHIWYPLSTISIDPCSLHSTLSNLYIFICLSNYNGFSLFSISHQINAFISLSWFWIDGLWILSFLFPLLYSVNCLYLFYYPIGLVY